ncbi:protein NDNF [Elysia marginata]|uniref:Protein NDNF n=1 Tax=Elysia marginata TaxID=1093978 RepID=A0AAV4GWG5_9GAST|nr:protein NDNF [Elysia marginata]
MHGIRIDLCHGSTEIPFQTLRFTTLPQERQWTMPMCESVLHLQLGPRLASSRQAVQFALLPPLPLVSQLVASFILLVAIAPCPSPGLHNNNNINSNNNGSTEVFVPEGQFKISSPAWNVKTNKTSHFITLEKGLVGVDHGVGGQTNVTLGYSGPSQSRRKEIGFRSSPGETDQASVHSRQRRSSFDARVAEIERRERLETHQGSHILTLNSQLRRYLYRRMTRRFWFTVRTRSPLEVVVTPCSSNITWSFLGPGHGQSKKRKVLYSYSGEERHSFETSVVIPNTYGIELQSLSEEYDSQVFIFVSNETNVAAGSGLMYPPLPSDPRVRARSGGSSRGTRKLDVWWKPAAPLSHGLRLEYCLAISRIRNFRSHCAALAYAGDVEGPKQASWGSKSEYRRRKKARKGFSMPVPARFKKRVFYTCVGNKTSFTYTDGTGNLILRGATKYYIDVFVKNLEKNTSSTYKGVSAKTKRKTLYRLKVGDSRAFVLRARKRPKVEIELSDTRSFPKLVLEITSCQGKIPVRIYHNHKKIREKKISRYKQIVIPNPMSGKLVVIFPLTKRKRKPARAPFIRHSSGFSSMKRRRRQKKKTGLTYVTLSLPPQRSPIKALPKDLSVSVLPYLSGCRNVTLEWRAAGKDYTYCVYHRQVAGKAFDPSKAVRDVCRAAGEEPRHTSLAGCISHRVTHPSRGTLTYNVHNLNPGSCYRFDVLINRTGMASVPYDGVRIRTPDHCQGEKPLTHNDFKCPRRSRRKGLLSAKRRRRKG